MVISRASDTGLDIPQVTGSIRFATVGYTGATAGTGATALRCAQAGLEVTASVLWTPNTLSSATVSGGCSVTGSIVGPASFGTNANMDPLFVDPMNGNFHISGGSPARDAVNTGPATDFENDHRPQGARFDLGADEAP